MVSRVMRSTELRVLSVEPDDVALRFIREAATTPVRIIANRSDTGLTLCPSQNVQQPRHGRRARRVKFGP